jgi:CRP-like cAMP-binding protein
MSAAACELLRQQPFFVAFDARTLALIAERSRAVEIKEREVIWREGDVADRLLLLIKGRCKVRLERSSGETIIDVLIAGEIAGDVAFALGERYRSDLVALRKSQALLIPMSAIREGFDLNPKLAATIAFSLGQKMVRLYRQLHDLSAGSVDSRLARLLVRLMERVGEPFPGGTFIPIKLRRRELAGMAATSLESVSRTLHRWEKDDLLILQPAGVVVKDRGRLAELAGESPLGQQDGARARVPRGR